VKKGHIII